MAYLMYKCPACGKVNQMTQFKKFWQIRIVPKNPNIGGMSFGNTEDVKIRCYSCNKSMRLFASEEPLSVLDKPFNEALSKIDNGYGGENNG